MIMDGLFDFTDELVTDLEGRCGMEARDWEDCWNSENDDQSGEDDSGYSPFEWAPGRDRRRRWEPGDDMDMFASEDSLWGNGEGVSTATNAMDCAKILANLTAGAVIGLLDTRKGRNATRRYVIYIMKQEDGMSHREIERVLGLDQNLVWNRYNRFRDKRYEFGLNSLKAEAAQLIYEQTNGRGSELAAPVEINERVEHIRLSVNRFVSGILRFWDKTGRQRDPLFAWACRLARTHDAPAYMAGRLKELPRRMTVAATAEYRRLRRGLASADAGMVTALAAELIPKEGSHDI